MPRIKLYRAGWVVVAATVMLTAAVAAKRYGSIDTSSAVPDTLVASIRSEPQSFNRYISRDFSSTVLTYLLHESLVRINRSTNQLEPALAEEWHLLDDQRTYRLSLRRNVQFSDGTAFSADDVVFSFRAIYDQSSASVLYDSLLISGQPLAVTAEDPSTVLIRFPSPFGPGLRILDGVPIYPRARLETALERKAFRKAWGLTTPPSELAGLGPFVLRSHEPGQRLTFDRNPRYWRKASGLPKLAHVVLEVMPDQQSESLRLETGGIDLTQSEIRPADFPALKRAQARGRVAIAESGIGIDGDLFWINLSVAKARDPRNRWLQHTDFRRAIADGIDRRAFADEVYFGAAVPADSIISAGNIEWHSVAPPASFDVEEAKRLLTALGLSDRDGDGIRDDENARPVRFTLFTQSGNTSLERGAAFIRQSLANIGVGVDVVALESAALISYIMRGEYDAAYFRLVTTDTDPALNLDFWLSTGDAHVWNPGQPKPGTNWERDIDTLMNQVAATVDADRRHALFTEVQRIMAREVPILCFAFPRLSIATSTRVVNATPAAFRPPILWNPAVIGLRSN